MIVELDEPGFYQFEINDKFGSLFLKPGDEIHLSITDASAEQFDETLSFSGKGATENNYLAAFNLVFEKALMEEEALMSLAPVDFLPAIMANYEPLSDFHREFIDQYPSISPGFLKRQEMEINAAMAFSIFNYISAQKEPTAQDSFEVPAHFYSQLEELLFDNLEPINSPIFNFMVNMYLHLKADKIYGEVNFDKPSYLQRTVERFDLIPELVQDESVRCFLYKELTLDYMRVFRDQHGLDTLMQVFAERCDGSPVEQELRTEYEKYARLFRGRKAPVFKGITTDGEPVSLSDFNDQYVYIDVWATWCGPCIKEQPDLEKLQEEFDDPKLVFMSMSIDDDKAVWEKMVKEKQLGGIQLLGKDAWQSDIMTGYLIYSIPHFILIGPGGVIVDAGAPRPSSEEIKELLTSLRLKESTSMTY